MSRTATAISKKKVTKAAKAVAEAKAKQEPAKAKKTQAEQEASDEKFYATAEKHGLVVDNARTGKRLSRFSVQAHALEQVWPKTPLTPEQIAENCTKRFGIKITAKRVERQLIDELRCKRVVKKGKGYAKTGVEAHRWSMNGSDE